MIIEFLGISGTGKTTKALEFYNELLDNNENVIWDTYELYANKSWFARNFYKICIVAIYSISHFLWILKYVKFVKKNIHKTRDFYTVFLNGVFLKRNYEKAICDKRIHIFDEGIFQHLWAVKLRGKKVVDQEDIEGVIKLFGIPDKIFVIYATPSTIIRRLMLRGEYVKIMDSEDLEGTIKKMIDVQESIVDSIADKIFVTRIDNN